MIVVADTSPINYLILIGQADLLPKLYGSIFIPHAVYDELLHAGAPTEVHAWAANPPHWLQFLSPSASPVAEIPGLDPGETEAIALAEEIHADWLLIDESAGRREAALRHLKIVGTIGILRSAHRLGLVDLNDALRRLQETRFHIHASLLQDLLDSI